jgi:hypothetical protein
MGHIFSRLVFDFGEQETTGGRTVKCKLGLPARCVAPLVSWQHPQAGGACRDKTRALRGLAQLAVFLTIAGYDRAGHALRRRFRQKA